MRHTKRRIGARKKTFRKSHNKSRKMRGGQLSDDCVKMLLKLSLRENEHNFSEKKIDILAVELMSSVSVLKTDYQELMNTLNFIDDNFNTPYNQFRQRVDEFVLASIQANDIN